MRSMTLLLALALSGVASAQDATITVTDLTGPPGDVSAVGLYLESRGESFQAVHVEGARAVAQATARGSAQALVHISGIGADLASESMLVLRMGKKKYFLLKAS